MKTLKYRNFFLVAFLGILFSSMCWSQLPDYYDVDAGQNKGFRLWNGNNNYKIHMGNGFQHKYGPVTDYAIKTNMNGDTKRGWTWGVTGKTPVFAVNTEGKLQTNSWIKTMGRTVLLGNVQKLYGDNRTALFYTSNHSTLTQLIMRDKENKIYGRLYGSGNGKYFGLLDGDGNWSYLSTKDETITFRIDNSEKMRIRDDGKVGIGSNIDYSPSGYRLFVQGGILSEKVKVAVESTSDWADYVFEEDYNLLPINEVNDFIKKHNHLPNVPSAEEVVDSGIDVAKMDAKLLEKIEEAHLYIIQLHEEIKVLKLNINELKNK